MKKVFLLVCIFCATLAMTAQEEKTIINQELSEGLSAIQTATELAKLGYSTYSPTALIEAARILAVTEYKETEFDKENTNVERNVEEKESKVSFDPKQLLADAKEIAGKDKTLLALIKQTEKVVDEALKNKGIVQQRGSDGGPYLFEDRVLANSTETYTCKFWGGQFAEVAIAGDGDTDLDLYIYDSDGDLIAKDDSTSGNCYCSWVPLWTDVFVIRVVNRGGVYNDFILATN